MPRDSVRLLVIGKMMNAVIIVSITSETPKFLEYITPANVFRYMKKMKMPMRNASAIVKRMRTTPISPNENVLDRPEKRLLRMSVMTKPPD